MNKTKTFTFIVVLMTSVLMMLSPKQTNAQPFGHVSFDLFYHELSPYGYWERDVNYGDIWFPARVGPNFRPYGTNGYWTMTEYGNTWVSGYDWGWATFHYGRWVYTPYNGWGWIPGYEWGPAWVDWRSGGGYYGWAPMAPNINVHVSVGVPFDFWVFIPTRRIYERRMDRYWSYGERNMYNRTTIINNTYVVNNNYYYGGPGRRDIERNIGRPVDVRTIYAMDRRAPSRVDQRSVRIYQPAGGREGAPSRVTTVGRGDWSDGRTGSSRSDRVSSRGEDIARGNSRQEIGRVPVRSGEAVSTESRSNSRGTEIPVDRRRDSDNRSGSAWGAPSRSNEGAGSRVDRSSSRGSEGGTIERVRSTESRGSSQPVRESVPIDRSSSRGAERPVSSSSRSETGGSVESVQPTRERSSERSTSSSREGGGGERSSGAGRTR